MLQIYFQHPLIFREKLPFSKKNLTTKYLIMKLINLNIPQVKE